MTRPGPWRSPEGHSLPFLGPHGDLTMPAEDLAETAYWHDLLIGYLEGRPPPASAKQPRVTAKLRLYAAIHRRGATEVAAGRARPLLGQHQAQPRLWFLTLPKCRHRQPRKRSRPRRRRI